MKTIAGVLGAACALTVSPLLAGSGFQAANQAAVVVSASGFAAFSKDEDDNEEGDREGGGVIDPTPQDDGSDGVDDGTGDA